MNYLCLSPNHPVGNRRLCEWLHRYGATVLGIGDASYDSLDESLRRALTEYYRVDSLADGESVYRAGAYFAYKYGRMDCLDSHIAFWAQQDARLRADFGIDKGPDPGMTALLASWTGQTGIFERAGVPAVPCLTVKNIEEAWSAATALGGYPVFGGHDDLSRSLTRIGDPQAMATEFDRLEAGSFIIRPQLTGDVFAWDAIVDSRGQVLFESATAWPGPTPEANREYPCIVTWAETPEALGRHGRAVLRALGIGSRFVHVVFYRLGEALPGVAGAGSYVGLEVDLNPAGGYLPDMMNYAHATDVYQIWAEMLTLDRRIRQDSGDHRYCVYAGRRDGTIYRVPHEKLVARYGSRMIDCRRISEDLRPALGDQGYVVRLDDEQKVQEFLDFVRA